MTTVKIKNFHHSQKFPWAPSHIHIPFLLYKVNPKHVSPMGVVTPQTALSLSTPIVDAAAHTDFDF